MRDDKRFYQSAKPGDLITFGRYPQTADGADETPITWRVLEKTGRELFVLSQYILDCKRYHGEFTDITWRSCDLRRWLNETFLDVALNSAEKELVKTTRCTGNGASSPDTRDRVFLLGVDELERVTGIIGKDIRRAIGTRFARVEKADGGHLYVYDKGVAENYVGDNGQQLGCSWWWLRTQLGSPSRATFVGTRASIRSYGRVNLAYYGVRPALKLRLR